MTPGLEIAGISLTRGDKPLVSGVRLSAPRGKVTGIVGPNGAGKSSLIGTIAGIERPDAGSVHFEGDDLLALSRRGRARLCAYVEQSTGTEERLSVFDVVALGRIPHGSVWAGGPTPEDDAVVRRALAQVCMDNFAPRLFNTLSGGEQQRVHIARALAQEPKLLVLDEPTSHLDIRGQLQVLDLLRQTAQRGCTVLLVLHDLNLALGQCDWIAVMDQGAIIAEGAPDTVLTEALLAEVYGVEARRIAGPDGPAFIYKTAL